MRHAPSWAFRLPLPWILAFRYWRSTRRDAFASFLSVVATGGIALGVTALILALALLSGFQRALLDQVLARTPELELTPASPEDLPALEAAVAAAGPGITAHRVLQGRGWLVREGHVEPVELVGFGGELPARFAGASSREAGLYIGAVLAQRWGLDVGDVLDVVSPYPTLTPLGPQPRVRSLRLVGTFDTGTTENGERVAVPVEIARSLFPGRPMLLEVEVGGTALAERRAAELLPSLPPGTIVRTWRDLNRPLLFALHLEKALTFIAVALIVAVASLALVASLSLVIASKQREIGILQACGASAVDLRRAFLALGALLAGAGVLVGGVLGVVSARWLDASRALSVPGGAYFMDYVPFRVQQVDVLIVLGATIVLSLASSLYAARRATVLTPVEAMRR